MVVTLTVALAVAVPAGSRDCDGHSWCLDWGLQSFSPVLLIQNRDHDCNAIVFVYRRNNGHVRLPYFVNNRSIDPVALLHPPLGAGLLIDKDRLSFFFVHTVDPEISAEGRYRYGQKKQSHKNSYLIHVLSFREIMRGESNPSDALLLQLADITGSSIVRVD
jgi:hypothetical protein